jgi:hypothetical protein
MRYVPDREINPPSFYEKESESELLSFAPEKPKEVNKAYEEYLKKLREKNQLKKDNK